MPIFDKLPRASFAGLEFPIEELRIEGEIRDHAHEYPHAPGGAPEKLGRRLYVFHFRAKFHATFRAYPGLYPGTWNRLRNKFEAETTDDLVVPLLGTVKAYAKTWTEVGSARSRSGVSVDMTFREDLQDAFTANALLVTADTGLQAAQTQLSIQKQIFAGTPANQIMLGPPPPIALDDLTKTPVLGLLDRIDDAINNVLAIQDQIEIANMVADAKVTRLLTLCEELDHLDPLATPRNDPLRDALHDVWGAANDRRRDIARRQEHIFVFATTLPRMSVTDVAYAIYGDSSRAMQILQLNHLPDPFNIPLGTPLRLYRATKLAA
jgi:hypothetical protein